MRRKRQRAEWNRSSLCLYDDKLVITFNHKEGAETITLDDVETALAEKENGSDLVSSAVPPQLLSDSSRLALTKETNRGWGLLGRLLNSGWNWTPR